jgi:hypothetical protein
VFSKLTLNRKKYTSKLSGILLKYFKFLRYVHNKLTFCKTFIAQFRILSLSWWLPRTRKVEVTMFKPADSEMYLEKEIQSNIRTQITSMVFECFCEKGVAAHLSDVIMSETTGETCITTNDIAFYNLIRLRKYSLQTCWINI